MRKLAVAVALFASFWVALSSTHAQQAKFYGKVTDTSGKPVNGAQVILEPADGEGARAYATTKKGSYLIGLVRPGSYRLKVQAEGMVPMSMKIRAKDIEKKPKWEYDERIDPEKPRVLEIGDGFEITCDLVLGTAVTVTTPEGTKGSVSAEQAYQTLAEQVQAGDCAGAMPGIRQIISTRPELPRPYYLAGFCQANAGKLDEALASLNKAIELEPTMPGVALLKGEVLGRLGRVEEAEALIKKEIESSTDPKVTTQGWIALGVLYRDKGRDADAVNAFQKIIELAPERPESYIELSVLYTKMGQPDQAAAILEEGAKKGASDTGALINVGITYLNKKDYVHATQFFERAIAQGGKNEDIGLAYALLGRCQLHDGQNDKGIASLKKSLELAPSSNLAEETREILKAFEPTKKK